MNDDINVFHSKRKNIKKVQKMQIEN